ncbi:MAG: phosphoglycerate kinase [Euryarchaeota archaeon]|nr:phosphoglycerate kinase [Euryarchaeota archaeon]
MAQKPMSYLTLDDVSTSGKTVLVRVDLNSPMSPDGSILDDARFKSHLPTLRDLADSRVVLLAHQSRPGKRDFTPMQIHAQRLQRLCGRTVTYVDDIFGSHAIDAIESMDNGDIILLENTRFYSEEGLSRSPEEHATTIMVKRLTPHVDMFVNDAFAVSHRSQLSVIGFTTVLPSVAGRLMEKEIESLGRGFSKEGTVFVLGGIKANDSIDVIENVAARSEIESIIVTGLVANVFLEASGVDLGKKNSDFMNSIGCAAETKRARKLLARYGDKIELPVDVACADQADPNKRVEMSVSELPTDLSINDIGLETIILFSEKIRNSQTVIMNGPAGLFENEGFELGTKELVTAAARSKFSIVGGGHIASEAHALGIESNISHISTGGGACIDFLSGRTLPGIESLVQSCARFKSKLRAVA